MNTCITYTSNTETFMFIRYNIYMNTCILHILCVINIAHICIICTAHLCIYLAESLAITAVVTNLTASVTIPIKPIVGSLRSTFRRTYRTVSSASLGSKPSCCNDCRTVIMIAHCTLYIASYSDFIIHIDANYICRCVHIFVNSNPLIVICMYIFVHRKIT